MPNIDILGKFNSKAADGVIADSKQIKGGYMVVADTTELEGLSTEVAPIGTQAYVQSEGLVYIKDSSGWVIYETLNLENGFGNNSVEQKSKGLAIGSNSIALNSGIAKGTNSFAETSGIAETVHSHAEGEWGIARGWASHAEGGETIATHSYQHVEGLVNEGKQLTQHEIGNGRFSFTAVSPKPDYHKATHFGSSGDGYGTTYYFADIDDNPGGHRLITEKSYTEEAYEALANVYTMNRDGKNIFEVYKYGSLSNGVHTEDLKLFMLAFIATQLPGSSYSLEGAILLGYQALSTALDPYLSNIKLYLAGVYPAYATQIAAATSIDQLMGLLVMAIFGTTTPTSNYIISPVSMANGLGNFIYSLASFVSGYGNTIGASNDVTSGTGSAAIGVNNTIKSQNSIAVGDSNLLERSNGSGALGYNNEVKPADDNSPAIVNAFAIGNHLKNNYSDSLAVGRYNADFDPSVERLFQVGNGSSTSGSNIFEACSDRVRISDPTIVITASMLIGSGTPGPYGNPYVTINLASVNYAVLSDERVNVIKLDLRSVKSNLGVPSDYAWLKRNVTNSQNGITLYQFTLNFDGFSYDHIADTTPYVQIMQIGSAGFIYEPTNHIAWLTYRNINPTDIYSRLNPTIDFVAGTKLVKATHSGGYELFESNYLHRCLIYFETKADIPGVSGVLGVSVTAIYPSSLDIPTGDSDWLKAGKMLGHGNMVTKSYLASGSFIYKDPSNNITYLAIVDHLSITPSYNSMSGTWSYSYSIYFNYFQITTLSGGGGAVISNQAPAHTHGISYNRAGSDLIGLIENDIDYIDLEEQRIIYKVY